MWEKINLFITFAPLSVNGTVLGCVVLAFLLQIWHLVFKPVCEQRGAADVVRSSIKPPEKVELEKEIWAFYYQKGCYFTAVVYCRIKSAIMACGATLKRSMEFEALLSPQSPKRRRCNPLPGTPTTPSPQRCGLRPSTESPAHSMSPQSMGGEHRLTPGEKNACFSPFNVGLFDMEEGNGGCLISANQLTLVDFWISTVR